MPIWQVSPLRIRLVVDRQLGDAFLDDGGGNRAAVGQDHLAKQRNAWRQGKEHEYELPLFYRAPSWAERHFSNGLALPAGTDSKGTKNPETAT